MTTSLTPEEMAQASRPQLARNAARARATARRAQRRGDSPAVQQRRMAEAAAANRREADNTAFLPSLERP